MGARRADPLQDLSVVVGLDAARCLDTADFLARHCGRYGINANLEFRRHQSSRPDGRHFVVCHHAGAPHPLAVAARAGHPLWVMHLQITGEPMSQRPAGTSGRRVIGSSPPAEVHRVSVMVLLPKARLPFGEASRAARAARDYQELLARALRTAETDRRRHREDPDSNVISLRPFIDLPPLISA